ncbi:MAG: hypothetical protein WBG54_23345 [Acidobacteriaceae bacterium]
MPPPAANTVAPLQDSLKIPHRQELSCRDSAYHEAQEGSVASQRLVGRNFNWIWFLGAAVWFIDAALSMRHGALGRGLFNAAISALFLAIGMIFRRLGRRAPPRDSQR